MTEYENRLAEWLRSLAEKGGKGTVDGIDARSLGRAAEAIQRLLGARDAARICAGADEQDKIILADHLGALLAVARQAAERFREYERHHAAKPDPEKAARNGEMAARLEAAIESSQRVVAIRALKEAP